jgi:hypothetical protein
MAREKRGRKHETSIPDLLTIGHQVKLDALVERLPGQRYCHQEGRSWKVMDGSAAWGHF